MNYRPLGKRDSLIILQGLLLLAVIIFTGVGTAQYQLAALTQKKEEVAFFSLARDDNYHYSVFFLGSGTHFGGLYHLGDVGQEDGLLICRTSVYQFSMPVHLRFEMNMEQVKLHFQEMGVYLKRQAYALKKELPIIFQYLPLII